MAYEIVITRVAEDELCALSAFNQRIVREGIETCLRHQPKQESRSRIKKLIQPAISEYRLRVREFRVYYDVIDDDNRVVVLHVYDKGRSTTPEQGEL